MTLTKQHSLKENKEAVKVFVEKQMTLIIWWTDDIRTATSTLNSGSKKVCCFFVRIFADKERGEYFGKNKDSDNKGV